MGQVAASSGHSDDLMRGRIMHAAEACFERHGVAKTTMEDVARAAKLSRPSLYRYFSNREELVGAVLIRALRTFNRRAAAAVEETASFEEALVTTVSLAVEMGVKDKYVRLALGPDSARSTLGVIGDAAFFEVALELWRPLLRQALDEGRVRHDLDVDTASRWLIDVEFLMATRVVDGSAQLNEVRELVRAFIVPGFGARPCVDLRDESGSAGNDARQMRVR